LARGWRDPPVRADADEVQHASNSASIPATWSVA
jgi:hypothetical protein